MTNDLKPQSPAVQPLLSPPVVEEDPVLLAIEGLGTQLTALELSVANSLGGAKPPAAEKPLKELGVIVLMATHNDAKHLPRGLRSIDRAMSGRKWALVVCDDGSKDVSLSIVRNFQCSAERVLSYGFEKAPTVSEAKNRLYRAARPLFHEYQWVTWHDPDDIMLENKIDFLLPRAVKHGHKVVVGGHRLVDKTKGGKVTHQPAGRAVSYLEFGPWATLLHVSVIPEDGAVFTVGDGAYDDLCAHWDMIRRGVTFGAFHGPPVHEYRKRPGSLTEGREDSLRRASESYMNENPVPDFIRSFCTIVTESVLPEAEVFLRTLRLFHKEPIVVMGDRKSCRKLRRLGLGRVTLLPTDDLEAGSSYRENFASPGEIASTYNEGAPPPAVMMKKLDVVESALTSFLNTLYLDCDMVVLGRFRADRHSKLILCNHQFYGGWDSFKYGRFNAGQFFCRPAALNEISDVFKSAEEGWHRWNKGDCLTEPHSPFLDQGFFDVLPDLERGGAPGEFGRSYFHPGYNVGVDVALVAFTDPEGEYDFVNACEKAGIETGHGIFIKGYPVVNFHVHLGGDRYWKHWPTLVRDCIKASELQAHKEVWSIVEQFSAS